MQVNEYALLAEICRESYYDFVKEFWSVIVPEEPVWAKHIKFQCEEAQRLLERVFRGEPKEYDLIVNVPPGSSKSTIWSVLLTPWAWTRMPSFRSINGSFSFPLAMDLSTKARDVVQSEKYQSCFGNVKLREDQNTKAYFKTDKNGFRYAVGVNGTVTGMHGHALIVDDPLDPQQAASEADTRSANHWLTNTLSSRKVNKAVVPTALIMQRLGVDDPTATFLRKKRVRHVCLPGEIAPNVSPPEARELYTNGLLDPIRLPKASLIEMHEDLGNFGYSCQVEQLPVPLEGGMFKPGRIKQVDFIPPGIKFTKMIRFWDKAGTTGGGAYTACVKMAKASNGTYWILHIDRFQKDSWDREAMIRKYAESDGVICKIGMEQEGASGGKESAERSSASLAGWSVHIAKVGKGAGSKELRADAFSVQVNAGNVYMLRNEYLGKAYLDELKHFPGSKYKDMTDASSGAFNWLSGRHLRVGGMW